MSKVNKKQKKLSLIMMTMLVLIICASSFMMMPINLVFASQESVDDYETFDNSLMQMLRQHDDWEDTEKTILEKQDYKIDDENETILLNEKTLKNYGFEKIETRDNSNSGFYSIDNLKIKNNTSIKIENDNVVIEKQPEINRLIINSDKKIDNCGASAVAEYNDYHIFQYDNEKQTENAYNYYSSLDYVYNVSYDYVVSTDGEVVESNATYKSWGAKYVGYDEYITTMLSTTSQENLNDIVVAVLDSGINTSHELFAGRILHQYAKNFTTETSPTSYAYEDRNGHGTHVSGTIAEATFSNVKILPLKVLNYDGKGLVSMIINALNYAISMKNTGVNIKVMNMSIGVDTSSTSKDSVSARGSTITSAVIDAYNSGLLPVVSAGNDSMDTSYAIPANVSQAITVSALVLKYSFPNGATLYFDSSYSNYGSSVDFSAPGTSIISAGINGATSYVSMSGTSMAAPHVTACVALIYSNPIYRDYSFSNLEKLLKENSIDYGTAGWDKYYGYGLINIANIGIVYSGEISFSVEEEFLTSPINLALSYNTDGISSDDIVKIYYTTSEDASSVDSTTGTLYSSPIKISSTTKISAVGFVYNSGGSLIKKSYFITKTYYFNNTDLLCNYTFEDSSYGKYITKYSGILTTLNVPKIVNGYNVIGINSLAFNDSKVSVLNLPNSVNKINDSAFSGNSKIKEIHCENTSVAIGNSAFRKCISLTTIDIPKIISIGDYAFANCTSINSLYLPIVRTIGTHAFSASSLKSILIGSEITAIGTQTSLSLTSVYGFANTVSKTFAEDNSINYTDITLRITKNLANSKIIKTSDVLNLSFEYAGYETTYNVNFTGGNDKITKSLTDINNYEKQLQLVISNLAVGTYQLNVNISDKFSNILNSNILEIKVVSNDTETFNLNFVENNYKVYVNGEKLNSSSALFKNFDYEILVLPYDGYSLNSISINGVGYAVNKSITMKNVTTDLNLVVATHEKASLMVSFNTDDKGVIKIEDMIVGDTSVKRDESIVFSISPNEGYVVKNVLMNENPLAADENGFYHVENIVVDVNIKIIFIESYYNINIALGKGGNISSAGGTIGSAAHGSSRTYVVSVNDGYEIDFVSVNGKIVSLTNNTFKLENIESDYDIIVSFKQESSMFTGNHFFILVYFVIFLSLFVLFILAKTILFFVRKNNIKKI